MDKDDWLKWISVDFLSKVGEHRPLRAHSLRAISTLGNGTDGRLFLRMYSNKDGSIGCLAVKEMNSRMVFMSENAVTALINEMNIMMKLNESSMRYFIRLEAVFQVLV